MAQHTVLYMHIVINTNHSHTALRHRYLPPDVQVQKRTLVPVGLYGLLVLTLNNLHEIFLNPVRHAYKDKWIKENTAGQVWAPLWNDPVWGVISSERQSGKGEECIYTHYTYSSSWILKHLQGGFRVWTHSINHEDSIKANYGLWNLTVLLAWDMTKNYCAPPCCAAPPCHACVCSWQKVLGSVPT